MKKIINHITIPVLLTIINFLSYFKSSFADTPGSDHSWEFSYLQQQPVCILAIPRDQLIYYEIGGVAIVFIIAIVALVVLYKIRRKNVNNN